MILSPASEHPVQTDKHRK